MFRSTAHNRGRPCSSAKDTKSTLKWPNMCLSQQALPTARAAPCRASWCALVCGNTDPMYLYPGDHNWSWALCNDTLPLGSTRTQADGEPRMSAGTASMTQPTRQKVSWNEAQSGKRSGRMILHLVGRTLRTSCIMRFTASSCLPGSNHIARSRLRSLAIEAWKGRAVASKSACPRPPNSSSILISHLVISMCWKISEDREAATSSISYRSNADGGAFTSAAAKTRFAPDLLPYTAATIGSGASMGRLRERQTWTSSGPTTPGMI
mmetsp:Transcript_30/g.80  ORF Transcript_30/g.80 Transcript_30/m.80 type:complete len:265 (-) Transcript_30:1936-2730(-)